MVLPNFAWNFKYSMRYLPSCIPHNNFVLTISNGSTGIIGNYCTFFVNKTIPYSKGKLVTINPLDPIAQHMFSPTCNELPSVYKIPLLILCWLLYIIEDVEKYNI